MILHDESLSPFNKDQCVRDLTVKIKALDDCRAKYKCCAPAVTTFVVYLVNILLIVMYSAMLLLFYTNQAK